MSLNNQKKRTIRPKALSVFGLVFLLSTRPLFCQEILQNIFATYYQTPLNYVFTAEIFSGSEKTPFVFTGTCNTYVETTNLHYRINLIKRSDTLDYIKNDQLFGCNKVNKNVYEDYLKEPEKTKELKSITNNLFFPDSSILKHLNHDKLDFALDSSDELYLIRRFSDKPTTVSSNIGNVTRKKLNIIHYVSKKDYKIIKTINCLEVDIEGYLSYDSTIYDYHYESAKSRKQIQKYINGFSALKEIQTLAPPVRLKKEIFPSFRLEDTLHQILDQSQITSNYVLVDFWYKSCGPCLIQFPTLRKVREKFSKEELAVLAINPFDKVDDSMMKFIRKTNYPFLYLFGAKKLRADLDITMFPSTILYDNQNKKIIFFDTGVNHDLVDHISQALDKFKREEKKSPNH